MKHKKSFGSGVLKLASRAAVPTSHASLKVVEMLQDRAAILVARAD